MPTRQEMWDRLGGHVDLLVIGGGINGAGIARDASRRGLKVVLVEMQDLASGTSSRSSKLVHGGLRYLEQFEFSLVFEAVSERRILMDIAPHLVNPLGFLFPVYKGDRRNLTTITAGMVLYEGLSLFRSPQRYRKLKPKHVAEEEPLLRGEGLKGAPLYYDCSTDDARLTLESALQAADTGAIVATWVKATGFEHDEGGRMVGVHLQDHFSGDTKTVRASAVINATGPWTDRTVQLSGVEDAADLLRPTKGIHIVVSRERLPVNHAVVCFHPQDGRVLFAIPWGDCTYVGTTDTDFDGDPADVHADRADVDYLIEVMAHYFPEANLTHDDVHCTWAGLRPLMRPPEKEGTELDESAVSREHRIVVGEDGLITIAGGKLTTYRLMSKEVVDTAVKLLRLRGEIPRKLNQARTDEEPLPGGVNWPADDDHGRVAEQVLDVGGGRIDNDTAQLLANTYGMRALDVARLTRQDQTLAERLVPHRPEILAQVDWAVHEELAARVTDVLKNRTQLFYREADQALACVDRVAARMQELLGWTDEQRDGSAKDYRREVEASRRWQTEPATVEPQAD